MPAATCRVSETAINGHRACLLENDSLRVIVLPEKGADIYALIHKPTGVDFLFKNPTGLAPPGAPPVEGHGGVPFLFNYEGAWQELFPNHDDATVYRGAELPFHGEAALLPWRDEIIMERPDEIAMRFTFNSPSLPLRLERVMRLQAGSLRLILDETVTNLSDEAIDFVWGHHCVIGEPFLEAGCRMDTSARTIISRDILYEEATARFAPGQRETFPLARTRDGRRIDLREIPGRAAHTHDDLYLTDLDGGWITVTNPRLGLTFSLHWDDQIFRWIIYWEVFGGADAPPFNGLPYALGIEPWVSNLPLGKAAETGSALRLDPFGVLTTTLEARVAEALKT